MACLSKSSSSACLRASIVSPKSIFLIEIFSSLNKSAAGLGGGGGSDVHVLVVLIDCGGVDEM